MAETPKKKKFEHMSSNEWLGDATTHFMKSGNTFRSPDNAEQEKLALMIPRIANGVKVEYDISFDIPNKIVGYKYTDFLTKAIYIAPNNFRWARESIRDAVLRGPNDDGMRVVNQLVSSITDKYILDNLDAEYVVDELIILPGTNLLIKDVVDMPKVDALVAAGAYVKLHPITSKVWQTMLTNRWKNKVIPADVPLYPILRAAKKIYFTMSSETGMAATMLGKQIGTINNPGKESYTNFEFIYRGMDLAAKDTKTTMMNRLIALFSHPESGVLTVFHDNPKERIDAYFDYMMKKYPHGK